MRVDTQFSGLISPDLLRAVMPAAKRLADTYAAPLSRAMSAFEIATPHRIAGFLASVAVESGQLRYTLEIADGAAYEGRADLGNTTPGDGRRYRGRGLIQITGRRNVTQCSRALFGDDRLLETPEILETPSWASTSAAWFWQSRGLNEIMDAGDFLGACSLINTGQRSAPKSRINGLAERLSFYSRANRALSGA